MSKGKESFSSFNYEELLNYINKTSEVEHNEAVLSFISSIKAVVNTVTNLCEEHKIALLIEGISVNISVKALNTKIFKAKIGPTKPDIKNALITLVKYMEKSNV